jgi:hypothetical protein
MATPSSAAAGSVNAGIEVSVTTFMFYVSGRKKKREGEEGRERRNKKRESGREELAEAGAHRRSTT